LGGGPTEKGEVRGQTVRGGVGGPEIALQLRTTQPVSAGLTAVFGYAVYGNIGRVDGDDPVRMAGPYLSVNLSVGLTLR
jgi:hypothetical protein